ncbi:hypothetical protein ACS0TY_034034 [Phlomoides rotata]
MNLIWDIIGGWSSSVGRRTWCKKGLNSSCIGTLCLYTFLDLFAYDGLKLCIKGDGSRYKLMVRISCDWVTVAYTIGFDTVKDQWQSVRLSFSSLGPIFRARTVSDAPPFDPSACFHEFYSNSDPLVFCIFCFLYPVCLYAIILQLMSSKFEYDGNLNPIFMEGSI